MTVCHHQIKRSKRVQIITLGTRYRIKRMGKVLKYMNLDYRIKCSVTLVASHGGGPIDLGFVDDGLDLILRMASGAPCPSAKSLISVESDVSHWSILFRQ
jgi:hypothetical protein